MGRRELFFFNITDSNIRSIIDVVKSIMVSHKHKIDIYPGDYGVNIVIEVSGTNEDLIKKIDFELSAKVLEICENRNIKAHLMEPMEIF